MLYLSKVLYITPLAIIRPEHFKTISGPWGLYTPVLFFQVHTVETVPSEVLILRLSEPRPILGNNLPEVASVEVQ